MDGYPGVGMKTIIVGMNNPLGAHPAHELYPAPERSTGHRLWRMLHEVSGATRVEYRDGFDRRNLVVGEWSAAQAAEGADRLFAELRELPPPRPGGKLLTVVALGDEVAGALLLRGQDIILPRVRDDG